MTQTVIMTQIGQVHITHTQLLVFSYQKYTSVHAIICTVLLLLLSVARYD